MRAAGMAHTIQLCRDLLDQGARHSHLCLNRSTAAEIVTALRESGHYSLRKRPKKPSGDESAGLFKSKKGGLKARYCPNLGRYLHHHLRAPVQAQSWGLLGSTGASG